MGSFPSSRIRTSHFPDSQDDAMWNRFWSRKLLAITRQGVYADSRPLRYRNRVIKLSGGTTLTTRVGEEKGVLRQKV
jgi:hypothetical protein